MNTNLQELKRFALKIRLGTVEALKSRGFGHIGGSLSVADLLAVLYGNIMRVDPKNPKWPERDKMVCSKGHAGPAVYATLGLKGFFPYDEIKTLNQPGTNFPSHCDRNKTPGVDMTTGSLGQGTSMAVGLALGDRIKGRDSRTYLIVGDGELDEGQAWEAFMFAAANKLDNLYVFIDWNKKQLDGYVSDVLEPFSFKEKMQAFGFDTKQVNGNDIEALLNAIKACESVKGKPHAIVMDTVKGCGIKEVEETMGNHSMSPKPEVFDRWIEGLKAELAQTEGGKIHD